MYTINNRLAIRLDERPKRDGQARRLNETVVGPDGLLRCRATKRCDAIH